MELQLVSYEQAKALKELGFPQNIYTSKVYLEKTIPHDIIAKECGLSDWQCIGGKLIPCSSDYNKYGVDTCSCPTLEIVAKWLREEKGILTIPKHITRIPNEFIYQDWVKVKNRMGFFTTGKTFSDYNDALSVGIDKAIEILKK